jgi:hypothetical protein
MHSATLPAPARPARRTVLAGLVILGMAIAVVALQRPLLAAGAGRSTGTRTALGEADGVVADGAAVSVFDDETPAVAKLDPELRKALRRAATDAAADGVRVGVNSGWRSPAYQQELLQEAVVEHGSREAAARWVSTPEKSAHVRGEAVDIGPFDAEAWLSEHGAAYGLCQIYDSEPWHYELRPEAVDDGCPPRYADPAEDPRMRP